MSGYFPIHYMTLQDSWNNKKLIKTRLDELKLAVAEIQNKKSTETESDSVTTSSNSANDSNLPPESSDKVS